MPSVFIKTYGCQMNERDSEAVAAQLVAKGYTLAPTEAVADMVMFALSVPANTCPLELAVINQQTPWTKPVIDYQQKQAK